MQRKVKYLSLCTLVVMLVLSVLPMNLMTVKAASTYSIKMTAVGGAFETTSVSSTDTEIYLGSKGLNISRLSDKESVFTKWDFVNATQVIKTYTVKIGETSYSVPADSYLSTSHESGATDPNTGIRYIYKIDGDVEISVSESEEIKEVSLTTISSSGESSTVNVPATAAIFLDAADLWWYDTKGDGTSSQRSQRLTPTGKVALAYDVDGTERYAMTDDSWLFAFNYPNGLTVKPKYTVDACVMTLSNIKIDDEHQGISVSFEVPRDNMEMQVVEDTDSNGNKFVLMKYYYSGMLSRTASFPVAVSEYPSSLLVGTTTYHMNDMIPVAGSTMELKFVYGSSSSGASSGASSSSSYSAAIAAALSGTSSTTNNTPVAAASATPDMSSNSSIDSAKVKTSANGTAKISDIKSEAKEVEINDTIEVDGVSYKVKTLGEGALKNCKNATEVTLPSSLTKIEKGAFTGAKKVKTIKLDVKKSITVQKGAFKGVNTEKMTIKVSRKMSDKEFAKFQKTLDKAGYEGKVTRSLK